MQLTTIETGNMMADGGAMFGVVPKVLWQKKYPANEDNFINLSMRCLLIDTGERRILVDTGIGNKQSEKFRSYHHLNGDASLKGSLEEAGYAPDSITDVVLTHLHFDHCGGSVIRNQEGKPEMLFPNAMHHVSQKQWDHFKDPNIREGSVFFKENIMPYKEAGLLNLVSEDQPLTPEVDLKIFDGHTPGQIIPHVRNHGKTVVYTGDLIPVAASVNLAWVSAYDIEPLVSIREKERFLKDAVAKDYILYFEHDLYTECCTVEETEKGFRVKETFKLSDI